jgi:hypothetical protein
MSEFILGFALFKEIIDHDSPMRTILQDYGPSETACRPGDIFQQLKITHFQIHANINHEDSVRDVTDGFKVMVNKGN